MGCQGLPKGQELPEPGECGYILCYSMCYNMVLTMFTAGKTKASAAKA